MVADLIVNPPQKGIASKISKVWIVPVIALLVSLFLAVQQYRNRDVTIRIDFPDASGIEEGTTELKFQKIKVGLVKEIRFSDDLENIQVLVDVDREIASYIDSDAKFWRVKPEISISGIRGLDTLLKGDYIHGEWDATRGTPENTFVAEEDPPLITAGEEGSEIHLVTLQSKPIVVGTPVYLRGIKVGIIKTVDLSEDGNSVVVALFVSAPYDQFINTGTRFWNASGIDLSLDTSGLDVQIASIATLLQGGIAFSTSLSGGEPITRNTVFDLHPTRRSAEESLLTDNLRAQARLSSIFGGSLKGLKIGADVEYHGLKVGRVVGISAIQNQTSDDGPALDLVVSYTVQPARLGLENIDNPEQTLLFLEDAVASNGLRSRLVSKSILGGLSIELFEDPNANIATLIHQDTGFPILPSVPTTPETLKVAAESVLKRVANLPIETVIAQVSHLIANIDELVTDEDTQNIPADIIAILENVDAFIQSEDFQAIPTSVEAALSSVNNQLETFESGEGVTNLLAALERVKTITENVETTSTKLPKLVDDTNVLINQVRDLPLDTVVASANDLVASVTELVESPETQGIPAELTSAIEQVRLAVLELRESGATENFNDALNAAQTTLANVDNQIAIFEADNGMENLAAALERVRTISENLETTSTKLPKIADEATALIEQVRELSVDTVITSANDLLASISEFVESPEIQGVPKDLSDALEQVRLAVLQVRESGATENFNATLDAAQATLSNVDTQLEIFESGNGMDNLVAALELVRTITENVETTSAKLPKLAVDATALIEQIRELPVDTVIASTNDLLASLTTLAESPETQRVPEALTGALEQVRLALQELREGGTTENINKTLGSAQAAMTSLAEAASDLPDLVAKLTRLSDTAKIAIEGVNPTSPVYRKVIGAIDNIDRTVRSLNSLIRQIERKPNSLLIGR